MSLIKVSWYVSRVKNMPSRSPSDPWGPWGVEKLTVIGKQSQYKKTEPRMRLVPLSKLPIRGLKFIEKQIFYPCPFFYLANLWFFYTKLEAKWWVKWEFSSFKLPAFAKKCYQLTLKNINSCQRLQKYFILQFNPKLLAKFEL